MNVLPLFGGIPAGPELLIIVAVVVLLFGAQKIPKLARSMGEATNEFKKGREKTEEELRDAISETEDNSAEEVKN